MLWAFGGPQIEFPFFHRLHAAVLFPWCGANPWAFKNWFEDNWVTDIYAPFARCGERAGADCRDIAAYLTRGHRFLF